MKHPCNFFEGRLKFPWNLVERPLEFLKIIHSFNNIETSLKASWNYSPERPLKLPNISIETLSKHPYNTLEVRWNLYGTSFNVFTKHLWNFHITSLKQPWNPLKPPWSFLEIPLRLPLNTLETVFKHPRNCLETTHKLTFLVVLYHKDQSFCCREICKTILTFV